MKERYMQQYVDTFESANGRYVARLMPAELSEGWQIGSIEGQGSSELEMRALAQAVVDNIKEVPQAELAYSDCTDGRLRVRLQDGTETGVPNREKLVGTDTVTAFAIAETLGSRFYANVDAPVDERVDEVVAFLKSHGLFASTHKSCGGAAGFPLIIQNIQKFNSEPNFIQRIQDFVPVYDAELYTNEMHKYGERMQTAELYKGYSDAIITRSVIDANGGHAVAEYKDDGRGVHGHVEEMIVRLRGITGASTDTNAIAEATAGRQVFVVNDERLRRLAELFRRDDNDNYPLAYMAAEAYTDAGHGTLAKNLPTLVIEYAS